MPLTHIHLKAEQIAEHDSTAIGAGRLTAVVAMVTYTSGLFGLLISRTLTRVKATSWYANLKHKFVSTSDLGCSDRFHCSSLIDCHNVMY